MKVFPATRSLCSCCLLLAAGLPLHGHVFTNPDGKTFEGEIVNGNEKTVTIERKGDKKAFVMERARLSENDQAHVAKWITDNPNVRLSIKTVKKSVDADTPDSRSVKNSEEFYEIEIRNESAQATPQLELRYMQRLTSRQSTGQGNSTTSNPGNAEVIHIQPIPAFRSTVVNSQSVKSTKTSHVSTETTQLSNGRTRIDQRSSKSRSGLSGISLVIFHNERRVAQHALMGMEKQTEELLRQGANSSAASSPGGTFP
ncbi:MAG: hypothetical protein EOP88_13815 [Verrucomicrobiaceae bacterium]|nr:MAG: hypothetical protein EOP88_13815 [Verrucomicrobiaceae bacterium]